MNNKNNPKILISLGKDIKVTKIQDLEQLSAEQLQKHIQITYKSKNVPFKIISLLNQKLNQEEKQ